MKKLSLLCIAVAIATTPLGAMAKSSGAEDQVSEIMISLNTKAQSKYSLPSKPTPVLFTFKIVDKKEPTLKLRLNKSGPQLLYNTSSEIKHHTWSDLQGVMLSMCIKARSTCEQMSFSNNSCYIPSGGQNRYLNLVLDPDTYEFQCNSSE